MRMKFSAKSIIIILFIVTKPISARKNDNVIKHELHTKKIYKNRFTLNPLTLPTTNFVSGIFILKIDLLNLDYLRTLFLLNDKHFFGIISSFTISYGARLNLRWARKLFGKKVQEMTDSELDQLKKFCLIMPFLNLCVGPFYRFKILRWFFLDSKLQIGYNFEKGIVLDKFVEELKGFGDNEDEKTRFLIRKYKNLEKFFSSPDFWGIFKISDKDLKKSCHSFLLKFSTGMCLENKRGVSLKILFNYEFIHNPINSEKNIVYLDLIFAGSKDF